MYRFSWQRWVRTLHRSVSRRRSLRQVATSVESVEDRTLLSIQLVSDINTISRDATPQEFVQIGSSTYFTADDGIHGRELWKTDGTAAGTVLVKDIHPTSGLYSGAYPTSLTNVGGTLYFVADDGVHGRELWKSDGTAGGTQMVADIQAGGAYSNSSPAGLVGFNSSLYFTADNGIHGRELWKSDGTSGGTQRITDLNATGDSFDLDTQPVSFNGNLIFAARQSATGTALFTSNGQAGGTTLLKDIKPGDEGVLDFDRTHVAATASTLYFIGNGGSTGGELWKTDGTPAGTVPVKDIRSGTASSEPQAFTLVGDTLYFVASESTAGQEVWKSDGTPNGTSLVKDIRSGTNGSSPQNLVSFQGKLYFAADDGSHGLELWTTDGSNAGTVLLNDINFTSSGSAPQSFLALGSTLYFTADDGVRGRELWKTDGIQAGTVLAKDIRAGLPGSAEAVGSPVLGSLNDTLLFAANDGQHGIDLWKSNGSTSTTVLVKDVNAVTQGSYPATPTNFAGGIVFAADDGQSGTEIWFSTGVTNSVVRLVDANSGTAGSDPADFTVVENVLYFSALNGALGRELWRTDGTSAGTLIVKDIAPGVASSDPGELVIFNGDLYFAATDDAFGRELWKTDGTALGTVRVADIASSGSSSSPDQFVVVGSTLYVRAKGDQLWKSDGTEGGTELVADILPDGDSQLGELTNLNGTLVFVANDGEHGVELWTSDGSEAGTLPLFDLLEGPDGSQPHALSVVNDQLFFIADDGEHGDELWVTDGSEAGTHIVLDIVTGPTSSQPAQLTAVNNQLFFVATDMTHGAEVWVTNGSEAGTHLVADLQLGTASSNPGNLTAVNGSLYFAANDGVHGLEPWKSNGTPGGTQLVTDVNPGAAGSLPRSFAANGSFLLFAADDGTHGIELMSDVANHGPVLAPTQFLVNPGTANSELIGTLLATDVDAGQTLTYTIESGNTSDAFVLNPTNGELRANNSAALDETVNPQFVLLIKVTDNGSPTGFVVTPITVNLTQPNQPPEISNQSFSVAENSVNNTVVGTVLTNDPDSGQALTYAILGGNTAGAFSINPATGQIRVANSAVLDYEDTATFSLTVQVTDDAEVPLSTSATITINVTNVDEPLQISLPPGTLNYTRGSAPALPGAGATVSDPDTPILNFQGGNVNMSISPGQIKTDKLTLVNGGGVTRKGKNVLFNGTAVGKLSGGKKGQPVTIALSNSATNAAVEQILRQVGYSNTSKKTPAGTRTIQLRVTDGNGRVTPPATKQIVLV